MSKEEELGIGKDRRKVDINEEYYRLAAKVCLFVLLPGKRMRIEITGGYTGSG